MSGEFFYWTCVQEWTRVQNSTCPVKKITGHKPCSKVKSVKNIPLMGGDWSQTVMEALPKTDLLSTVVKPWSIIAIWSEFSV